MWIDDVSTAPVYRAVEAQSGALAPVTMATAYVLLESLAADRDALVEKVQEGQAEAANIAFLLGESGRQVGRLSTELAHALADRDDFREAADEWREKYEAVQCRLEELEEEGP